MIKGITELNERFYELYGRLYENSEQLTKEQTESVAKKLFANYEREYELLMLRDEIEQAREAYELRLKRNAMIPRTWRGWFFRRKYNRAAVLSAEVVQAEVARYFASQRKKCAAETKTPAAAQPDAQGGQPPAEGQPQSDTQPSSQDGAKFSADPQGEAQSPQDGQPPAGAQEPAQGAETAA